MQRGGYLNLNPRREYQNALTSLALRHLCVCVGTSCSPDNPEPRENVKVAGALDRKSCVMIMIRTVVADILRLLVPRARTFIIIETGPEKLKLLIVHKYCAKFFFGFNPFLKPAACAYFSYGIRAPIFVDLRLVRYCGL